MKRIIAMLLTNFIMVAAAHANPVEVKIMWDEDQQNITDGAPIREWGDYPVGLANEMTGDRTWLGEIHLVAIYDRMLREDEIVAHFQAGKDSTDQEGAIAAYRLDEGSGSTVTDSTENPVNLTITPAESTSWITGGLSVNASAVIRSEGTTNKVVTAIRKSSAFTVEVWVKPANLSQAGPARIVTISQDTEFRNVTLGQVEGMYVAHCKNSVTTDNGIPSLNAAGYATIELTHVTYAIDARGAATIYINGIPAASQHTLVEHMRWERLRFFDRVEGQNYDYANPLLMLPQSYGANGHSKPVTAVLNSEYKNFVASKNYFVIRSYAGEIGTNEIFSVNSTEVMLEMDMTRPPKTVLSMTKIPDAYRFNWMDTGARTKKYRLQCSSQDPAVERRGYEVLETVSAPKLTVDVSESKMWETFADSGTVWCTMVSITKELIYSRWTEEDVRVGKSTEL